MKRVLIITSDESLTGGLAEATDLPNVTLESADGWSDAQTKLAADSYQAVCLDYDSVKIEGLDSFIQLDDMLQKQETGALILLRDESPRAEEFVSMLDSFERAVNLATDPVGEYLTSLHSLLDDQDDPAETRQSRPTREPTVEVVLPAIHEGSLEEHSIARIVHTLRQQEWSGRLELASSEMTREVSIAEGRLVAPAEAADDDRSAFSHLQAAFAWSDGDYSFERGDAAEGERIEPYPVLLEGVQNHLDQRTAMNQLTPVMDQYVARTSFLEASGDLLAGDEALEAFVEQADGETTLEEALSAIASRVLTGFQAGFLAIECDLVALTDEPTGTPVQVEFSSSETSAERQSSGGRAGVSPQSSATTSHDEPDTAEREAELRRTYERISESNPYEVFELWEGCGEQEVRDRYFKLVKRHHPDSYGGNISDEAKELAEKIFIRIKQVYSDLLDREDEQRVSREEAEASDTTGDAALDESLTSPSVTAMGDGQELGGERSEKPTEPSVEMGSPTTEEMAAPAASREFSTAEVDPEDNEARMRYGNNDGPEGGSSPDSDPGRDSSEQLGDARTGPEDKERTDKIKKIRDRLADKADRDSMKTPVAPGARQEKIDSLGGSDDADEHRVDDLEPAESKEEAQNYFNAGYRAFKNEEEDRAHALFEKAHEFDPDHALWKTFFAYTLFLRNPDRRDDARELLREAIQSEDKQARPDAHLFLGRIQKVRGEEERAKRHFERAVELNPNSVEAKRELRVFEMRDDDPDSSDDSDNFLNKLFDNDLF